VSLQQLRKDLAGQKGMGCGQRKSPTPELHIMMDHTSPASSFILNVSNYAWRNGLSSVLMDPHQETAKTAAVALLAASVAVLASTIINRVKKSRLDVFLNATTTSPTKKIVAKVHTQIACNDAVFTAVIDKLQHT
jgi:hypothetical protein